jgi:hypothetical protein
VCAASTCHNPRRRRKVHRQRVESISLLFFFFFFFSWSSSAASPPPLPLSAPSLRLEVPRLSVPPLASMYMLPLVWRAFVACGDYHGGLIETKTKRAALQSRKLANRQKTPHLPHLNDQSQHPPPPPPRAWH